MAKTYTEDEIRDAFIRMFHASGEWWFPYGKDNEDIEQTADDADDFLAFLADPKKECEGGNS